jgi:hypothetical protein
LVPSVDFASLYREKRENERARERETEEQKGKKNAERERERAPARRRDRETFTSSRLRNEKKETNFDIAYINFSHAEKETTQRRKSS